LQGVAVVRYWLLLLNHELESDSVKVVILYRCCRVLHGVAVCCSVLQCVAVVKDYLLLPNHEPDLHIVRVVLLK